MYCKIIEAMLKEFHTQIYVKRIGDATLKGKDGRQFIDLLDENGVIDTSDKDLTIGSFAYSIVYTRKENNVDEPDTFIRSAKKLKLGELLAKTETLRRLIRFGVNMPSHWLLFKGYAINLHMKPLRLRVRTLSGLLTLCLMVANC